MFRLHNNRAQITESRMRALAQRDTLIDAECANLRRLTDPRPIEEFLFRLIIPLAVNHRYFLAKRQMRYMRILKFTLHDYSLRTQCD